MAECKGTTTDKSYLMACLLFVFSRLRLQFKGSFLMRRCENCRGFSLKTERLELEVQIEKVICCKNCYDLYTSYEEIGEIITLIRLQEDYLRRMKRCGPHCVCLAKLQELIDSNTNVLNRMGKDLGLYDLRKHQISIKAVLTLLNHRDQHRLPHDLIRMLKSFLY